LIPTPVSVYTVVTGKFPIGNNDPERREIYEISGGVRSVLSPIQAKYLATLVPIVVKLPHTRRFIS